MEVEVIMEKFPAAHAGDTGGGYAKQKLEVYVDSDLDGHKQTEIVIHEIIEVYCPFLIHDKVDELTDLLVDGIEQLLKGNDIQ